MNLLLLPLSALTILGLLGLLLWWHMAERRAASQHHRTGHTREMQLLARWLPLVVAAFLVLQLAGWSLVPFSLSDSARSGLTLVGFIVFVLAGLLALWSRETLGSNWARAADYQVIPGQKLVTEGPYRLSRHPMYFAFWLLFISVELIVGSWLILLALPLLWILIWQAQQEDALLEREFGQPWHDYRQHTSLFFPGL